MKILRGSPVAAMAKLSFSTVALVCDLDGPLWLRPSVEKARFEYLINGWITKRIEYNTVDDLMGRAWGWSRVLDFCHF